MTRLECVLGLRVHACAFAVDGRTDEVNRIAIAVARARLVHLIHPHTI